MGDQGDCCYWAAITFNWPGSQSSQSSQSSGSRRYALNGFRRGSRFKNRLYEGSRRLIKQLLRLQIIST